MKSSRFYITDRFRRDFPFVRWHRDVAWVETVEGQEVVLSKLRESAVHKTDIRQRCQFCDVGGKTKAFNSADQTQHLTSIPAPAEDGFRVKLCPCCSRQRRNWLDRRRCPLKHCKVQKPDHAARMCS